MNRTHRSRLARTLVATVAAGTLLAVGAASAAMATSAHAEPVGNAESIALSWDGQHYNSTLTRSFLGDPVVVPGDSATGTLLVRNDGPTSGILRASIVNVRILDPDAPDMHHNVNHPGALSGGEGNFYDHLAVTWDGGSASFTELDVEEQTQIMQVHLDEGEQVPIRLSYGIGVEATTGNQANVDPRLASFDVLLEIGGELPTEIPAGVPTEVLTEEDREGPTALPAQSGPPGLQNTGVSGVTLLLILGAIALGVGTALRFGTRGTTPDPGQ